MSDNKNQKSLLILILNLINVKVKQDEILSKWRIDVTMCYQPTDRPTEWLTDGLQELLEWLFATKKRTWLCVAQSKFSWYIILKC